MTRAPGSKDDGVSSVVSAVLLVALFVSVSIMWTVTTLPQWVADREQSHALAVQEAFGGLAGGLDSLSANGDEGPLAVGLALGAQAVPFVQQTQASGSLALQDTLTADVTFDAGSHLLFVNGAPAGAPEFPIEGEDDDQTEVIAGVMDFTALVVRLSTTGVKQANDYAEVVVVADDGVNTVSAIVTHAGKTGGGGSSSNTAGCEEFELRLDVVADIGGVTRTTTQALLCGVGIDLPSYAIDLANPIYNFYQEIQRLSSPFSLTLMDDHDGTGVESDGYFALAYVDVEGTQQGIGQGPAIASALGHSGPRLVYDPLYQSWGHQEAAWEFGGIVVTQDDGQAVARSPAFALQVGGGSGHLSWTLSGLEGSGAKAGQGEALARLRHVQTTDLIVAATGATFVLHTPSAAAWQSFFQDQATLAGAGSAVTATAVGDVLTLRLDTSVAWQIHLRMIEAHVDVL